MLLVNSVSPEKLLAVILVGGLDGAFELTTLLHDVVGTWDSRKMGSFCLACGKPLDNTCILFGVSFG